jgi:hypothetical protein
MNTENLLIQRIEWRTRIAYIQYILAPSKIRNLDPNGLAAQDSAATEPWVQAGTFRLQERRVSLADAQTL